MAKKKAKKKVVRRSASAGRKPVRKKVARKVAKKKKVARKATRKKVVRKVAKKRVARKATRKKVVRKATRKKVARKATRKKVVRKVAKKRVVRKATRKKVVRKVVQKKKVTRKVVQKKVTRKAVQKKVTRPKVARKPTVRSTNRRAMTPMAGKALKKSESSRFRVLLLKKRESLVGDLKSLESQAFKTSGQDASANHMADHGSDNYEQEFTFGLIENDEEAMRQINEALLRIENGKYGLCQECGLLIPVPRLEVLPWAGCCVKCQEQNERF